MASQPIDIQQQQITDGPSKELILEHLATPRGPLSFTIDGEKVDIRIYSLDPTHRLPPPSEEWRVSCSIDWKERILIYDSNKRTGELLPK